MFANWSIPEQRINEINNVFESSFIDLFSYSLCWMSICAQVGVVFPSAILAPNFRSALGILMTYYTTKVQAVFFPKEFCFLMTLQVQCIRIVCTLATYTSFGF